MRGPSRLGLVAFGATGTVDLGNDPPLVVGGDEEDDTTHIQRAVSWRWMTGTVLTGLTSIALMGAALIVAVSNPSQFASLPESLVARAIDAGSIIFGRKGDRLHPIEERVSTRQLLQVSTVTHQGDRDFIKLKPFVKINATLSADPKFADEVPAYDPVAIFADTSTPDDTATDAPSVTVASADQAAAAPLEGIVSTKVTDFPVASADLDPAIVLGATEVEQIVRASAHLTPADDPSLAGAVDVGGDAGDIKIVQENVSNIAKSDAGILLDEGYQERMIAVSKPENLRQLFSDNNIRGDEADEIIAALSQLIDVSRLRPGQKVRVALASDAALSAADQANLDADPAADPAAAAAVQKTLHPIRVSIYDDGAHQATVARSDTNQFVRADEPSAMPESFADAAPVDETPAGGPPTLYDAVYETALAQQVPKPMIDRLIRVFAYDVDLQSRIGSGDALELFHSMPDPDVKDQPQADPEILYAALTLGGVAKRYYRFRTGDDGIVDFYDPDGKSAKKFLVRKPLTVGRITSGFGWRVHPILGYRRLHAGVDYGAPRGTPVLAAGNGVVEKAGPSSGYGNLTLIRHPNGYETAYGHQQGFAKGIAPGVKVHQGQVIGYVGSTGLSTGPHLHFEIRVNGQPVDPLRIRLPRGRVLDGDYLVAFEQERARVDDLLGNGDTTTPPGAVTASLTDDGSSDAAPADAAPADAGATDSGDE